MENKKSERNNNRMEFGMRIASRSILEEINKGSNENLVISPLSIHVALNMLASGSTGRTLEQLLGFLESDSITDLNAQSSLFMELVTGDTQDDDDLPDLPPDDSICQEPITSGSKRRFSAIRNPRSESGLHSFRRNQFPQRSRRRRSLLSSYENPPSNEKGPIICLVNGIWVDKRFPLKHSFKQLAEDVYKANAQSVDFLNQGKEVTDEINSWAKEVSKGHIDPLLTDPIRGAILVLANALYFKGTWADPFKTSNTEDEEFHLLNGETVKVPFMKRRNTHTFYGSFDGFKLLRMEYKYKFGKDCKRYAMYIFLPDKKDGLKELVEKFNSDPSFLLENNRKVQHVQLKKLWLPKFKFRYELDLRTSMKGLGLDLPFDRERAEIKEIVETREVVYVSDAIQKAYIEVNEEGTIATAVTAFGLIGGSTRFMKPPELDFVADHPFLFMIKEEKSGVVLFVGAALNPLA